MFSALCNLVITDFLIPIKSGRNPQLLGPHRAVIAVIVSSGVPIKPFFSIRLFTYTYIHIYQAIYLNRDGVMT